MVDNPNAKLDPESGDAPIAPTVTAAPAAQTSTQGSGPGSSAIALEVGRGLDVGTANLVAAAQDVEGSVTFKLQRNVFLDIDADAYTKNMLTRLNVQYVVLEGRMVVVGDPAFELANIFNRETRRPMQRGVVSAGETDALPIEKLLLEKLLGTPTKPGEICYFSVPAEPIDGDFNVIYHRGVFEGLLRQVGYSAKTLVEGHAVVFAEMSDNDFSGIGISCGGGMFNICVAYKSIPALSFATCRGGDWIDRNVAQVLGIKASRATAIKERGVDLRSTKTREEQAIEIYYRNLIHHTLVQIKERFEKAEGMPNFPEPVDIVCAGGTSLIGGFIEIFRDEFAKLKFPIPIRTIRLAEDPLYSVSKGCLVAALSEA
ncbi:MAG: hypothetical protein JXP34_03680 [Planctomycetes bacterium]|nr:hypothetical protein [Planctomycetota bacterium]